MGYADRVPIQYLFQTPVYAASLEVGLGGAR